MKLIKNLYGCAICSESFCAPSYLIQHVQKKHQEVETSKNNGENNFMEAEILNVTSQTKYSKGDILPLENVSKYDKKDNGIQSQESALDFAGLVFEV